MVRYETAVPIGKGGMGEVARAWDPTLRRWVALKFLRYADPELEERMVAEARAQARVQHPNVCQVFEVGRHDGRVFIAMQFIDGKPLNEAARDLVTEQKVALVRTVAEAIHAAHTAGLVHRDIKPANILVETLEDGSLKPSVVDFGIAREHEVPGATVTGQVLGTPGYLSPEQARGESTTIDRRSDVFSLGVVLYELFGGVRPHPGNSEVETLVSLLEREPVPLRRRAPHVPRDLESVVMKCLENDRERRYPSARALAEDLGRFLTGEPVEARPISVARRLAVWTRRHRAAAAALTAAGAVVAVLAAALLGLWVKHTVDLKRERDAARAAQAAAEERRREAVEVTDFLLGLFEASDPSQSGRKDITARELLDAGAARLERELAGQPRTRTRLLNTMAIAYGSLGQPEEGRMLAEEALALSREIAGADSPEAAASLAALGQVAATNRDWEAAVTVLRSALEIASRRSSEREVASIKLSLGEVLLARRAFDEADTLNQEAVEAFRRLDGEDARSLLMALNARGEILRAKKDYGAAETLYLEVLERTRRTLGEAHPLAAATLNNLGFLARTQNQLPQAEGWYRQSLAVCGKAYEPAQPETLMVMQNLAAVLVLQEKDDEALALLRELAVRRRAVLPQPHWRTGSDLVVGVGRLLMMRRRYAEAEPVLREGLSVYVAALGADHTWVATSRGTLSACLFGLGRKVEATVLAEQGLAGLAARPTLPREAVQDAERVAQFLEEAGERGFAARYRALATAGREPTAK